MNYISKIKLMSVLGGTIAIGGASFATTLTTSCGNGVVPNNKLQFDTDNTTLLGFVLGYHPSSNSKLIIPEKTVSIAPGAFDSAAHSSAKKLTKVDFTLATSLNLIGEYAFWGCPLIGALTIPENVISIGEGAFAQCSRLTSLTISESVTSIGDGAFAKCSGLTGTLTIPNSVISLSKYAFSFCSGITGVIISTNITELDQYVFAYCSGITAVNIPNNIVKISISAFNACRALTAISCNYDSNPTVYYSTFTDVNAIGVVTNIGSVDSSELCEYFQETGGLPSGWTPALT